MKRAGVIFVALLWIMSFAGFRPTIHVLSMGDSWSNQWVGDMVAEIESRGDTVVAHNKGIYGSTAHLWADAGSLLLADVVVYLNSHPEIEWIVISLGGNDMLAEYNLGGGYGMALFGIIETDVRQIVNTLVVARPSLKIWVNGYDFLNFEQSPLCILLGQEIFGPSLTYNQNLVVAQLTATAQSVAGDYAQVHAANLLGSMQAADGVPGAPNFLLPSPAHYFVYDDCVHPSVGGYRVLMSHIYDEFFGPLNPDVTTTTTTTTSTTSTTQSPDDDTDDDDADDDTDDDSDDDDDADDDTDDDADDDGDDDIGNGDVDDDADDDFGEDDDSGDPASDGETSSEDERHRDDGSGTGACGF
ncbi:MAG: SGNH/GDSL hydrolase family protein [Deltaproteobacteria bacterium]|nr:SGNH/GDSL hydrolase family protein [Deltaproteobacteria bacterium]